MLTAAAFCPPPPLLVPQIAQAAAPQLDALRAACAAAVDRLYAAGPEILAVVGSGGPSQGAPVRSRGSFHRFGVDLAVDGGWPDPDPAANPEDPDKADPERADSERADSERAYSGRVDAVDMPLAHLVAAWLLSDRPATPPREAFAAGGAGGAAALGRTLAARPERIALLVMGDGSASRTLKAPGHLDPRAEGYDEAVAKALATADHRALAALDPALSDELLVAGWPAWIAAAAAAAGSGRGYDAELLYDEAPYGVGYFVATWVEA